MTFGPFSNPLHVTVLEPADPGGTFGPFSDPLHISVGPSEWLVVVDGELVPVVLSTAV